MSGSLGINERGRRGNSESGGGGGRHCYAEEEDSEITERMINVMGWLMGRKGFDNVEEKLWQLMAQEEDAEPLVCDGVDSVLLTWLQQDR